MEKEKIELTIGGSKYTVLTDKSVEYTERIAALIDERTNEIMQNGRFITQNQAVVLFCMECVDEAFNADIERVDLRERLRTSLTDAAEAKTERDALLRENQKLKAEIKELKKKSSEGKKSDKTEK